MSQKYIKSQNKNSHNAKTFGKYYAKPVYLYFFYLSMSLISSTSLPYFNSCHSPFTFECSGSIYLSSFKSAIARLMVASLTPRLS